MTRPARIPRSLPKHERKPQHRIRRAHLAWLVALGVCICCGAPATEAMHVRAGADGGMGMKPSDRFSLPGCHACHMRQHQIDVLLELANRDA